MRKFPYSRTAAKRMLQYVDLGSADHADPDVVEQLRVGMQVEHEHDDLVDGDPFAVAKIAAAHIREDPWYYLWLTALEAHRDGKRPPAEVSLSVNQVREGWCLVAYLKGHEIPLWGQVFPTQVEAMGAKALLEAQPALGVVYAWMVLLEQQKA